MEVLLRGFTVGKALELGSFGSSKSNVVGLERPQGSLSFTFWKEEKFMRFLIYNYNLDLHFLFIYVKFHELSYL